MARLVFKGEQRSGEVLQLKAGVNRIGRHPENDLPISNSSVSGSHCEITVDDTAVHLRDLGSTNGTFVDGKRTQESTLQPGQTVTLGTVDLLLCPDETAPGAVTVAPAPLPVARRVAARPVAVADRLTPAPPVTGAVYVAAAPQPVAEGQSAGSAAGFATAVVGRNSEDCSRHSGTPAKFICQKCGNRFCEPCVRTTHLAGRSYRHCPSCGGFCVDLAEHHKALDRQLLTFYNSIRGAFAYPLAGNGPWLLVGGTIYFSFLEWASWFFSLTGGLGVLSGAYWLVMACGVGYLFAFMQSIINTSIHGDDRLPGWPEVTSVVEDVLMPCFRFSAIWGACLAPGILLLTLVSIPAGIAVLALGVLCLPMAMLTVAIADSIGGLNPLIIFSAIGKLRGQYLVACGIFLLFAGVRVACEWAMDLARIPIVPTIVGVIVMLYGLSVEMRVLGLLFFTNRDKLGWFK